MLLTNTDLPQAEFEVLGIVVGSKVRAVHLGKDIVAFFKNIFGGEVREYSELMQKTRMSAMEDMIAEAEKLGANGIVGIRFSSSQIASGMAEIIAYGTAVKF